ncbi:hypothetical protein ACFBZI_11660 [Moraxella sp. ZJ142]|uniref:hypothetical protein n=1 Tax=Moraxella marmotae TaxID=3344520 RepID=UPI0035D46EFB
MNLEHYKKLLPTIKEWINEYAQMPFFLASAAIDVAKIQSDNDILQCVLSLKIALLDKILTKLDENYFLRLGSELKPILDNLYYYDEWVNDQNLNTAVQNAHLAVLRSYVNLDDDVVFENEHDLAIKGEYQGKRFTDLPQLHDLVFGDIELDN